MLAFRLLQPPEESNNPVLQLDVGADLREIKRVNETVVEFCDENNLPVGISQKLCVIFDDLLNNTISYGFDDDADHNISIHLEAMKDRLVIEVADDGIPFNPFDRIGPDTSLSVEEREIGGLGVLLVTEMTDSQTYHRRRDQNVITLTINLVS